MFCFLFQNNINMKCLKVSIIHKYLNSTPSITNTTFIQDEQDDNDDDFNENKPLTFLCYLHNSIILLNNISSLNNHNY